MSGTKDKIRAAVGKWISQVRAATVNSIASITPPGNRYQKGTSGQRAKAGIADLKTRIEQRFAIKSGYPASPDSIYSPDGGAPSHIYLLDKGKGKRAPRHTNLPVLNSARAVHDWWIKNSQLNKKAQRVPNARAYAFVSKAAYLRKAAKDIEKHAGLFISGWFSLFEHLGKSISRYTQKSALTTAKSKNLSKIKMDERNFQLSAYNEAQDAPRMDKYGQYIVDRDIPKTQAYYLDKM